MLDLRKLSILVVGGGNVAYRKAKSILDSGGGFSAIALEFTADFLDLINKNGFDYKVKSFEKEDIGNHNLIFSCTNDRATNELIFEEACKKFLLINVVDVPELCNFIMPAVIKRGKMIISISTQGLAPFYAKKQKEELDELLSPLLEDVTELAGLFRLKVLQLENLSMRSKEALFRAFLEINWQKVIYQFGLEYAQNKLDDLIAKYLSGN